MRYRFRLMLSAVSVLCLCLSSCENPHHNYEYYMEHPEALKTSLTQCGRKTSDAHCAAVNKARHDLFALTLKIESNPWAFGQEILKNQFTLSQLKEMRRKTAKERRARQSEAAGSALVEKIRQKYRKIKQQLAMIRFIEDF